MGFLRTCAALGTLRTVKSRVHGTCDIRYWYSVDYGLPGILYAVLLVYSSTLHSFVYSSRVAALGHQVPGCAVKIARCA